MRNTLFTFITFFASALLSNIDLSAADNVPDLLAATYKITNSTSTATCFLLRRNNIKTEQDEIFLVTAAHVLERMTGETCQFVLRTRDEKGKHLRKEVPIKIRNAKQPLWRRHPDVDVAVLSAAALKTEAVQSLDYDQVLGEAQLVKGKLQLADEVWIPCYPAQLEANSAGYAVLRRATVASYPLLPVKTYKTYLLDYSNFGGDSGAPVLKRDTRKKLSLAGIVIGQHRETTRIVSPIEERTVHRPLGLAIVVHAEFIRQTISLQRKK